MLIHARDAGRTLNHRNQMADFMGRSFLKEMRDSIQGIVQIHFNCSTVIATDSDTTKCLTRLFTVNPGIFGELIHQLLGDGDDGVIVRRSRAEFYIEAGDIFHRTGDNVRSGNSDFLIPYVILSRD